MKNFTSFMKPMIIDFINYRKVSQSWNFNYEATLKMFENHCLKKFPNAKNLTQEMIDSWCFQRDTEKNKSYNNRTKVIRAFLEYTNSRNLTKLKLPEILKSEKYKYIPHAFTEQEFSNFFKACDEMELKLKSKVGKLKKLSVPVFFRLLYSTGMRHIEARLLKRENVDLTEGIINIEESKSYSQHYVALCESMKELLTIYDKEINKLYPNRIYFFTTPKNEPHHRKWVDRNFKEAWKKYNTTDAIPYDIRHHYAITNINSWINQDINFTANLYYLSKSMGHSSIEKTKYYYALTPAISDIFKNQIQDDFNNIVPGGNGYNEEI